MENLTIEKRYEFGCPNILKSDLQNFLGLDPRKEMFDIATEYEFFESLRNKDSFVYDTASGKTTMITVWDSLIS